MIIITILARNFHASVTSLVSDTLGGNKTQAYDLNNGNIILNVHFTTNMLTGKVLPWQCTDQCVPRASAGKGAQQHGITALIPVNIKQEQ